MSLEPSFICSLQNALDLNKCINLSVDKELTLPQTEEF